MSRVNTGMELAGMDEINAELQRLAQDGPDLALDIAELAAEGLVSEAQQEEVVPYATGFLSTQHGVERGPRDVTIFANASYAAAQHANHPEKFGWLRQTVVGKGMDQIRRAAEIVFARREGL